jgi:hypothetical protein
LTSEKLEISKDIYILFKFYDSKINLKNNFKKLDLLLDKQIIFTMFNKYYFF